MTFVGVSEQEAANQSERSREMAQYNQAIAEINDDDNLIFEGELKGGIRPRLSLHTSPPTVTPRYPLQR